MKDRFTIEYDERGVQLHNQYIQHIIDGIIWHNTKHGVKVDKPDCLYGMLCGNKDVLAIWERILTEEEYLKPM